jgi:hypothetical protein
MMKCCQARIHPMFDGDGRLFISSVDVSSFQFAAAQTVSRSPTDSLATVGAVVGGAFDVIGAGIGAG